MHFRDKAADIGYENSQRSNFLAPPPTLTHTHTQCSSNSGRVLTEIGRRGICLKQRAEGAAVDTDNDTDLCLSLWGLLTYTHQRFILYECVLLNNNAKKVEIWSNRTFSTGTVKEMMNFWKPLSISVCFLYKNKLKQLKHNTWLLWKGWKL